MGRPCNRKTVAKLMKQAGIRASTVKKFRVSTTDSSHKLPIADNIVNRDFAPAGKNITWVADITYIPTFQGCPLEAFMRHMLAVLLTRAAAAEKIS